MSVQLQFAPLHAQNPRLTHAVFVAATVPHTKSLARRQAQFRRRGQAVLAHAAVLYGDKITASLWLQLRPRQVDAWLAAHRLEWLAQVVGMLHTYALSGELVLPAPVASPTASAKLAEAEKQWTLAQRLPSRVGAWIFHSDAADATGWQLLQAVAKAPVAAAPLAAQLQLPTSDPAVLKRALQVVVPAFTPLPASWLAAKAKPTTAAVAPLKKAAPKLPAVAPQLVQTLLQQLQTTAHSGAVYQQVLPLAVNLASVVNALRGFGPIQALRLVAPQVTSGGLHELAPTLDQALILDHATVTLVSGFAAKPSAATVADLAELAAAGVGVFTTKRPLGARLLQVEFAQVTLTISGSSDLAASDYHTSIELDTLTIAVHDLYAAWRQSLTPHLLAATLTAPKPTHRQRLLSKHPDALANFKARVAGMPPGDTQQRLTAWLYYQPQPPLTLHLDGVAYFALAFPQYHTVVIDTFTPNNALFFKHTENAAGAAIELAQVTSKQALLAQGGQRAYHTSEPIRHRVRRILGQGV
ncbi:hypothetical protein ACFQ5J_08570 [Lacticaseibacillus baoqingensis]|uniref:Uncharacterized protein n=1 Tax=Lacticaseibacillus baoqingensis TaxID=2486013 RepID=A0ABW4E859_9LACO|nr:hypothetical protein [Lacticaseibacillus baoqingensis]